MSTRSKPVLTEPAAAAAGCTAQCPGEQTDYPDGWAREYTLSASAASGWRFVKFTWSKVRHTASGTTPIGDYESSSNPSTAADGLAEARIYGDKTYWQEDLIENIVAHFEQAPVAYTITTAVTPAGSGTATGGGTYTSGTIATLTATAAAGYQFLRWELNGTTVSTGATYSVTVTANATYTAVFESLGYHVQVVAFKSDGRVSLNGQPGDDTQSAWTVADGYFPSGTTITIGATPFDQAMFPFKAWYRDPSAWGNPEQTGTIVPRAGATYTTTVTADVVYFAVFYDYSNRITAKTYAESATGQEAPNAVVTINGQGDGDNDYSLAVLMGSSVTIQTTAYGSLDYRGDPLYFVHWIYYDYSGGETTVSDDLTYTFDAPQEIHSDYVAEYLPHYTLQTGVHPVASAGSVALSPSSRYGNNLYADGTSVTLTATPTANYRFVKWILRDQYGDEDISTSSTIVVQITYRTNDYTYIAVFEWDGTDLLVNSFNRSTPVQLVYDPATNKLVADY